MKIKAGIIGGSGYTGIEVLRILHQHPKAEVVAICSRAFHGKKIKEIFPNLAGLTNLTFSTPNLESFNKCDVVFFATPHGVVGGCLLVPRVLACSSGASLFLGC